LPVESREDLSSRILLAQNQILQRIVQGGSLSEGLAFFCKGVEEAVPGSRCCVTLLNQTDKTLKVVAAPRLPAAFVEAVDQITIGLGPGSCSAAAYNNETIVSADMKADSEWEGMRERVLESGLAACWSCPIRGVRWAEEPSGHDEVRVLGTVALYFEQTRTPSDTELQALEIGAALAGMTINTARTQESIGRQKLYDSVTELPNRKLFTQQLKQVLRQVNPQEHKLGILLVDLDHFKEVNDTFGYAVGDFLLQSVAGRLLALRRKTDILARFGDDEFSYLIAEIRDTEDMKAIAAEALEAVSAPHDFGGQKLAVSASIGGSLYPWDGEDAQTLLRNAENALYTAKKQGLPAEGCQLRPSNRRRRGADLLEPPGHGTDRPGEVHSAGGRDGPDHPARRMGLAGGLPASQEMAPGRKLGFECFGEYLGNPVSRARVRRER
jgi:diguanylate cyclase (GGDEF)-like protein